MLGAHRKKAASAGGLDRAKIENQFRPSAATISSTLWRISIR